MPSVSSPTNAGRQSALRLTLRVTGSSNTDRRNTDDNLGGTDQPPSNPDDSSAVSEDDRFAAPNRELVTAQLFAAGALGVWERDDDTVVAWFPQAPVDLPDELATGAQWDEEPDRDWQAEWKATIAPVHAGRFVIVPTWLTNPDGQRPVGADRRPTRLPEASQESVEIVIDPGRAFGTGHHATTAMCLELLDQLAAERATVTGNPDASLGALRLLDLGCGSGILAIAAAKLGAQTIAVDTDPDAVAVTQENSLVNNVAPASMAAQVGSVELLTGPFDVVVANIITDTIASLTDELDRLTAPNGTLIVSGISVERQQDALAPLAQRGWVPTRLLQRDGWVAANLRQGGVRP